jgi:hypothetical protein
MTPALCPHCGQELPNPTAHITPRELDVLACWWMTDTVKAAAVMAGVGEQRAKNMLRAARIRNRVPTNVALLSLHYPAVRERAVDLASHKIRREAA